MKKIYTLILFLIATFPVIAQQQIFVEKSSDTEVIEFSKLDKITFEDTTVKFLKTDGTSTSASMGDINRIYFSIYNTIENLEAQENDIISFISNDNIAVNCNAGEIITIYDIIGHQLLCMRQKSDNGIISIAHLPRGLYIIRANDQTVKFVRR